MSRTTYGDKPAPLCIELDSGNYEPCGRTLTRLFKAPSQGRGRGRSIVEKKNSLAMFAAASMRTIGEQTRRAGCHPRLGYLARGSKSNSEGLEKRKSSHAPKKANPFPARRNDSAALWSMAVKFFSGAAAGRTTNSHFKWRLPTTSGFHAGDYSGSHVVIRNPQREKEPS